MAQALIWLHVCGNLVWIGSILAVAVVIAGPGGATKAGGEAALAIYRRLASPAFALSFLCGAVQLILSFRLYLVATHWMHAKLPFALAVIGIHHVIGARARKLEQGTVQDAGPTAILGFALAVAAALAAFFAIFRIPH